MRKKIFILITVALWSCISEIQKPTEASLTISNFQIDYDQLEERIYLQVTTEIENDSMTAVRVHITAVDPQFDTLFMLNDSAKTGDLIALNGVYAGSFEIQLPFNKYDLKVVAQTHSGIEVSHESTMEVEEQFPPGFVDVIFTKKYEDGSGYEFDSNSPYFINAEDTSYLNFQIRIKDLNGLENIQSIRYHTLTNWLYADSTGGEGCSSCIEDCSNTSPHYYMTNIASDDSILTYIAINDYIKEPGFKINPTSVCNRQGTITFSFIILDSFYGPITFPGIELFFSNCNEGDWNCDKDCEYCPTVCGECSE